MIATGYYNIRYFNFFIQEGGSGSDVEMRSEGSELGPDSPGTDAATAGSRSGAGSPPPTTHDGSPQGSPGGMNGCVFSEPVAF